MDDIALDIMYMSKVDANRFLKKRKEIQGTTSGSDRPDSPEIVEFLARARLESYADE